MPHNMPLISRQVLTRHATNSELALAWHGVYRGYAFMARARGSNGLARAHAHMARIHLADYFESISVEGRQGDFWNPPKYETLDDIRKES